MDNVMSHFFGLSFSSLLLYIGFFGEEESGSGMTEEVGEGDAVRNRKTETTIKKKTVKKNCLGKVETETSLELNILRKCNLYLSVPLFITFTDAGSWWL